jgi:hypothetical protein
MLNALKQFDLSVQEVALKLHSMVERVLFGTKPWPPEPVVVNATLDKLGVEECIDAGGTSRLSRLGKEVDADLFRIWLGGFEVWDTLWIIEERGLICSIDAEEMWERIEAGDDVRRELRLLLQQSYLAHYGHHRRH